MKFSNFQPQTENLSNNNNSDHSDDALSECDISLEKPILDAPNVTDTVKTVIEKQIEHNVLVRSFLNFINFSTSTSRTSFLKKMC